MVNSPTVVLALAVITSAYGFGPFFELADGGAAGSAAEASLDDAVPVFFFWANAFIWSAKRTKKRAIDLRLRIDFIILILED
jgi:hypothetical protein